MLLYAVDVAPGLAARLPEVAGVLDLLDDSGGHLADTVGHGDPAGGTDLHLLLALGADHVTVLAAGDGWGAGDGEADRTLHRLLELSEEALRLLPLLGQLELSLHQPGLQPGNLHHRSPDGAGVALLADLVTVTGAGLIVTGSPRVGDPQEGRTVPPLLGDGSGLLLVLVDLRRKIFECYNSPFCPDSHPRRRRETDWKPSLSISFLSSHSESEIVSRTIPKDFLTNVIKFEINHRV